MGVIVSGNVAGADRWTGRRYAGGPEHYAAYLEDEDGYEVELVAD